MSAAGWSVLDFVTGRIFIGFVNTSNLARSHRQSGQGVGAGPNKRFSQKILTVATVELLAI